MVVMKGPEATAGSIFILCMRSGTSEPASVATIRVMKIEIPTNNPSIKSSCQKKTIKMMAIPHVRPIIRPVPASRRTSFHLLSCSNSPVAIPLTATANACVPVFPAMPPINGINTARIAFWLSVSSNRPIRLAVSKPKNKRMTNHGSRFFAAENGLLSTWSRSDIPANLE